LCLKPGEVLARPGLAEPIYETPQEAIESVSQNAEEFSIPSLN